MIATVNLVATKERLLADFPADAERINARPGVMSADYRVDTERCTKLGGWLAEHIGTTRFDDDASQLTLMVPATEFGLVVGELGQSLARDTKISNLQSAERVFGRLEAWIHQQRGVLDMYGDSLFSRRVFEFQWPVFGSRKAGDAETPETYFDACARQIRQMGAVIVRAGLSGERPPLSLQRTITNAAEWLLEEYDGNRRSPAEVSD